MLSNAMFFRFFRSIYHYKNDLLITFTCSTSNKMLNTFTTLGVPLKDGGRGGPENAKCFGPFGTNAALFRIDGGQDLAYARAIVALIEGRTDAASVNLKDAIHGGYPSVLIDMYPDFDIVRQN
jgi:hypothetical protein